MNRRIAYFSLKHVYSRPFLSCLLSVLLAGVLFAQFFLGVNLYDNLSHEKTGLSQTLTFITRSGNKDNTDAFISGLGRFRSKIQTIVILGTTELSADITAESSSGTGTAQSEKVQVVSFYPSVPDIYRAEAKAGSTLEDAGNAGVFLAKDWIDHESSIAFTDLTPGQRIHLNGTEAVLTGYGTVEYLSAIVAGVAVMAPYEDFFSYTKNSDSVLVFTEAGLTDADFASMNQIGMHCLKTNAEEPLRKDRSTVFDYLLIPAATEVVCILLLVLILHSVISSRMLEYAIYRIAGGSVRNIIFSVITEYGLILLMATAVLVTGTAVVSATEYFPITKDMLSPGYIGANIAVFLASTVLCIGLFIPELAKKNMRQLYSNYKM